MAAATLPTKKAVNKGKIKKTLKNVLCRPDPVFWPAVSETQKKILETAISKYRVEIPEFKKPQWKDLKLIPKEKRPKPPKIQRVEGLLFGVSECCHAIKSNSCAAILLESSVNPRAIVQPAIEACINSRVPVICVSDLRTMSATYFGIPTSCLGIKCDCLQDLHTQVVEITKCFNLPQVTEVKTESKEVKDVTDTKDLKPEAQLGSSTCPYLYRTSKKTRIFNPSEGKVEEKNDFSGQEFIKFEGNTDPSNLEKVDRKSYMKMVLKKISNNPKRVKVN